MKDLASPRDRTRAAAAALALQVALGWALIAGLGVAMPGTADRSLAVFTVPPPPPRPPVPKSAPLTDRAPRREGAAAPPNLKAHATEVVAPPVVIPPPQPPPVIAAPVAHDGAAPIQGAAPLPGPGTGAGGTGDGFGSGDGGDGDGGGGGGSPLRQVGGRITGRDYPIDLLRARRGGVVWVRYVVGVNGRVSDCRIEQSSGYRELDDTTCALITERFRFRPRRDASGRKVPGVVVEDHTWLPPDDPPDDGDER